MHRPHAFRPWLVVVAFTLIGAQFLHLTTGRGASAFAGSAPRTSTAPLAAFAPGNLVVSRVGDGSTAAAGVAAPVFLDEYAVTGGARFSRWHCPSRRPARRLA